MYLTSGSSRGGFAPRGVRSRGGRAPHFTKTREQLKPDIERHPLGVIVETIRSSGLSVGAIGSTQIPEISGCKYVASYNWLNSEVPTIIVPGKPPRWTPLVTPQRLREDSGQYYRDHNAAKYPEYPIAPVVHAVVGTSPEFPTASVDIFACGSTLGNLLRFARGIDKAFRFNIELVGNTVFFIRKENGPKELIKDVRGFGHTFPEAYTTWDNDVKESETHQRIIQYTFGGLNCLVRFESDGYIKDVSTGNDKVPDGGTADEDDLLQALQNTAISHPFKKFSKTMDRISVNHGGSVVPQSSIFDLKTRSGKHNKDINMSDILPQLWLKQIPNFILAYHDGHGLFQDIRVQDIRNDVQTWQTENQDGIRRFATLLAKIVRVVKNEKRVLLEVYCPGSDRLEIRGQYGDGMHALPMQLADRWAEDGSETGLVTLGPSGDEDHGLDDDEEELSDNSPRVLDRNFDDDCDSDTEQDFTACSPDGCGYCGKCTY
ncbi:geranylgeranyl pyrophosphate synthetase [Pyrenophora seminiperda CCB06]|uniref:Geranylgeranyl pyrophosphate synthetase n=1 Tax=Pyrenophora seminiperda CCB06 TaxID=1302712 RepID=A0A3M7LZ23_9PLEO|nr:geranylgeranyl pyrophosphate synthetase [Pyrenophora seminiperda CCB06]